MRGRAPVATRMTSASKARSPSTVAATTRVGDATCRIVALARSLGRVTTLPPSEIEALAALKRQWSTVDPWLDRTGGSPGDGA